MKCFLDLDGVLADFVGGVCKAHNRTCYDKPEHLGEFSLEKCWGISAEAFWRPTNNWDFWFNLEKTPEANAIVELAFSSFGEKNVAILTSPSLDHSCVPAKRAWMEKHYPSLAKGMIFSWGKGVIGGPERVLVDDRDRNVEDWNEAGGCGILVPRPWNKYHLYSHMAFRFVKEEIEEEVACSKV